MCPMLAPAGDPQASPAVLYPPNNWSASQSMQHTLLQSNSSRMHTDAEVSPAAAGSTRHTACCTQQQHKTRNIQRTAYSATSSPAAPPNTQFDVCDSNMKHAACNIQHTAHTPHQQRHCQAWCARLCRRPVRLRQLGQLVDPAHNLLYPTAAGSMQHTTYSATSSPSAPTTHTHLSEQQHATCNMQRTLLTSSGTVRLGARGCAGGLSGCGSSGSW
jgi:hypothetical protein